MSEPQYERVGELGLPVKDVYECQACASLVIDREKHTRAHRQQADINLAAIR